ncbi:MAG: 50S ribosomal protein L10, partial [Clostridiales bacterium]
MDKKPQAIEKEAQVAELQKLFSECQAAIITDYRGLTVSQDTVLRNKMRNAGIEYRVAKNTLIKIACQQLGQEGLEPFLNGPTAVAFAQDPAAAAKLMSEFIKESKKTEIKAALLGGKLITAAAVEVLGKLPSREVLLGQVAGAMQAPMAAFAGVC